MSGRAAGGRREGRRGVPGGARIFHLFRAFRAFHVLRFPVCGEAALRRASRNVTYWRRKRAMMRRSSSIMRTSVKDNASLSSSELSAGRLNMPCASPTRQGAR